MDGFFLLKFIFAWLLYIFTYTLRYKQIHKNIRFMKTIILSLGILLSLCVTMFAQEKKIISFGSKTDVWVWDIMTPVYTTDGDTVTYLTILTLKKIEKISFSIEWRCQNGDIIKTDEKAIIRHGSVPWTNDRPDVFKKSDGIWYNIYVLPVPQFKSHVDTTRFAGTFRYAKNTVNMGQSVAPY